MKISFGSLRSCYSNSGKGSSYLSWMLSFLSSSISTPLIEIGVMKGAGDEDFLVFGEAVRARLETESCRTGGDLSIEIE